MKRVALVGGIVLLALAMASVYQYWFVFAALGGPARSRLVSQSDVDRVVAWAAQQHVERGRVKTLDLPVPLAAATTDGKVRVAQLKDGRTCALLIEAWGYKDNFDGILACNAALQRGEIVHSDNYPGRSYISLAGYQVFEELYVSSKRNDGTYNVYFDLN